MTVNNTLLFDLSDIRSIQIECSKCRALSGAPANDWRETRSRCFNCGETLFQSGSLEQQALVAIQNGLSDLSKTKTGAFTLRFEVNSFGDRASGGKD